MRSGRSSRSARLVHTCGVMQLTCDSQRSVSASSAIAWVTSPPRRRGTLTRCTHSGAPFGISCCTTRWRSIPAFQRHRFSGRLRTCGTITGATAA